MGLGEAGEITLNSDPGDDESSLSSTKDPEAWNRTKHIDVQHITSVSRSMKRNCLLPEYRAQT